MHPSGCIFFMSYAAVVTFPVCAVLYQSIGVSPIPFR